MAPPMPATKAATPPRRTFICRTLIPMVLAPCSLERTAPRASPVVELRRLNVIMATAKKTAKQNQVKMRPPATMWGGVTLIPMP